MRITLSQNRAAQILALAGQAANIYSAGASPKTSLMIGIGLSAFQMIVAQIAHKSNPDGTPAEIAYDDGKKVVAGSPTTR